MSFKTASTSVPSVVSRPVQAIVGQFWAIESDEVAKILLAQMAESIPLAYNGRRISSPYSLYGDSFLSLLSQ